MEASAQESFIASTRQARSWEEVFLSVDGIVCSGGNTLNQQAIWKAQGIDLVLRRAWDSGIVLGQALVSEGLRVVTAYPWPLQTMLLQHSCGCANQEGVTATTDQATGDSP